MMDEYEGRSRQDLLDLIDEIDKECFELTAYVIELINIVGWQEPKRNYTFSDGTEWYEFNVEEKLDDE